MLEQREFTADSEAEAKRAADAWWAQQAGLTRLSDYAGPTGEHLARQTGHRWVATIIYEAASRQKKRG
jgi:hypothetical protein